MILGRWITSIAQCRQAAFLAHLCLSRLLLDRFCSCCSVLKQSQAISCNLLEPKDLETNGTLVPCSWNEAFPWCRAPPYGSPCTGMTKSDLGVDLAELAFVSACVAGVVGSDYDCFVYHLVVYIYITSSIDIYLVYTLMYQSFTIIIKGSLAQKLPIYERHLSKVKSSRVVSSRVESSRVVSSRVVSSRVESSI